jgi:hypothetical protein
MTINEEDRIAREAVLRTPRTVPAQPIIVNVLVDRDGNPRRHVKWHSRDDCAGIRAEQKKYPDAIYKQMSSNALPIGMPYCGHCPRDGIGA